MPIESPYMSFYIMAVLIFALSVNIYFDIDNENVHVLNLDHYKGPRSNANSYYNR